MANVASKKTAQRTEFGDWQTPLELARKICLFVSREFQPSSVFEPNCGKGAFLRASISAFPEASEFVGLEINGAYVQEAQEIESSRLRIIHDDFFSYRWDKDIQCLPEPLLVIGNPPWVTNAELTRLRSKNLPVKSNFNGVNGIDAITGKSNFDISEWMLIKEVEALQGRNALLAMLCKTAIARKVLLYAWKNRLAFSKAQIREIDAPKYFAVAVDACVLIIRFCPQFNREDSSCPVYSSFDATEPDYVLGIRNGRLVSNAEVVDRYQDLLASGAPEFMWRSGIKHDCSKVMELSVRSDGRLVNGFKECVDIEEALLYPMLKSSDLANGTIQSIRRFMLVPQRNVGGETISIESLYPKTWLYLMEHAERLDKRGSSIYRNRPRFSIFGVGDYSFKPWKIAISGLYKSLRFRVIGPYVGKPVVFDDTCYFLACETEEEVNIIGRVLKSQVAREILTAHIFWDSKRPITRDVLSVIDIAAVARHIGIFDSLAKVCSHFSFHKQPTLFDSMT